MSRYMPKIVLLLSVTLAVFRGAAFAESAEQLIRQLLMETFDKPEAQLVVEPIVVVNDHAVADWVQGSHGGRALLKSRDGRWSLILCSGDGIKSAAALQQAGVPAPDAVKLSEGLERAEKIIPPETRALLATFEGTVVMGADSHHAVSDHHSSSK